MTKRYLNVSYEDRDLAKRLGAKWDPSVRRWYCVANSPLSKIFEWRKETKVSSHASEKKQTSANQKVITLDTHVFKRPKLKSSSFTASSQNIAKSSENLELFA